MLIIYNNQYIMNRIRDHNSSFASALKLLFNHCCSHKKLMFCNFWSWILHLNNVVRRSKVGIAFS